MLKVTHQILPCWTHFKDLPWIIAHRVGLSGAPLNRVLFSFLCLTYWLSKTTWIADIQWPSDPVRCQRRHIHLFFCNCLRSADSSSVSDCTTASIRLPHRSCLSLCSWLPHSFSLSKIPTAKLQWASWVSGSLTLPDRHQSQGSKGSTPVTLRNASGEKKLISSAGSQPRGVLRGDWSQWEALLGGGYKSSLNPMTQQSWVRVRWHFAAI